MAYYTIIVPLRFQDNLLSITNPFSSSVWTCLLICIPICIGAVITMNYLYSGYTNWEVAASSIIRAALSERNAQNIFPPKPLYQKLLVLVWALMMVVLVSAYKGNLLAIITKPTIVTPFSNSEEMVNQNDIKWKYPHGVFPSYAKTKSPGTTLRKIIDHAISPSTPVDICPNIAKKYTNIAIICDVSSATFVIANDFSKTGTCNYYLTRDKILASDNALAFPVSIVM